MTAGPFLFIFELSENSFEDTENARVGYMDYYRKYLKEDYHERK